MFDMTWFRSRSVNEPLPELEDREVVGRVAEYVECLVAALLRDPDDVALVRQPPDPVQRRGRRVASEAKVRRPAKVSTINARMWRAAAEEDILS